MITAKGDGSLEDFLHWAHDAGHFSVGVAYGNYKDFCEYMKDVCTTLSEQQRHVEE